MKFETKIKLRGGEFSSFYSTIKRAEDYYKCLANTGADISKSAPDILYWRILFGLKLRLETIAVKKQNQLVTHISINLNDIESICLLNAILPPDNNSFNQAVAYEVRNQVYKSISSHVFNLYPSPAFSLPVNLQVNPKRAAGELISISDARHSISNFDVFGLEYKIQSFKPSPEGRSVIRYNSLDEALEDGTRMEPIQIQVEDLGTYVVNTK